MKQKASFLGVPCYYDDEYETIIERYGNINAILLELTTTAWCWIYRNRPLVAWPVKINKQKSSKIVYE